MDSKKNKGKRKESVDRTSFYKPIGLYLKAVRESECISVEQMHEILQTPETHINKYERGEVKVPLHVFVKYCEVGKISPSELLNWNMEENTAGIINPDVKENDFLLIRLKRKKVSNRKAKNTRYISAEDKEWINKELPEDTQPDLSSSESQESEHQSPQPNVSASDRVMMYFSKILDIIKESEEKSSKNNNSNNNSSE